MTARETAGSILIGVTAVFTVYLSVVMLRRIRAVTRKESFRQIFLGELLVCGGFLLLALDLRFDLWRAMPSALRVIGWALRAAGGLAAAVFLFFLGRVAAGCVLRTDGPARHALVLGLALEHGRPVPDLLARLDTAEAFARENPDALLVLTGGNPDASGLTEAAVMGRILRARGIAEERMLPEDRAETTRDNFRNTALLINPATPVVLISSDYHMDRAVRTARAAGFTTVLRRPAPSSRLHFAANVMWEVMLEVHELTQRQG